MTPWGWGFERTRLHSYRGPGKSRSTSGTAIDQIASDQRIPFVRYKPNWMKPASATTSAAKRILPAREFGVVLGSEIMKKAKRSSAPLSIR